jgi:hypothetical protein
MVPGKAALTKLTWWLLVKSDGGLKILARGVTRSQHWKYPTVHKRSTFLKLRAPSYFY